MRKALILFLALFISIALNAQKPPPPYFEPMQALFPYEKKISALQGDLYNLLARLNVDDRFTCISIAKDMEILRLRIKTSIIITYMYQEGTEQGATFIGGNIMNDYHETRIILTDGAKSIKKALASVKNPLLVQLGLEGARMMESSLEKIEKLYLAVKAPTSF